MSDLFRRQVLEHLGRRKEGGISLLQPWPTWLWAALSVLAALLVCAFLAFGDYRRRSTVSGDLVPDLGLITVASPTDGVVQRVFPDEGDSVAANAVLVSIADPRSTGASDTSTHAIEREIRSQGASLRELDAARVEQLGVQARGVDAQLASAKLELAQLHKEIDTSRQRVDVGRKLLERYQQIASQKYISEMQLAQQQQDVLDQTSREQQLERDAISLSRTIADLEQKRREIPASRVALLATAGQEQSELRQRELSQQANGNYTIRTPVPGLVAARAVEPGQAVRAGQELMTVLPRGSVLQAQLLVPSSAIGFVDVGDTVLLRYQAFPFQKFGHHRGRVVKISRSMLSPTLDAPNASSRESRFFRVTVALERQSVEVYGKPESLRPGMALEADILGEKRRLFEWILDPLYSVRGRVAANQ
jgi:membrane fusion protein